MTLDVREAEKRAKEARARAEKATPGPWRLFYRHGGRRPPIVAVMFGPARQEVVAWPGFDSSDVPKSHWRRNGTFIAAARTDVPALCGDVEALTDLARRLARDANTAQDRLLLLVGVLRTEDQRRDTVGWSEEIEPVLAAARAAGLLEAEGCGDALLASEAGNPPLIVQDGCNGGCEGTCTCGLRGGGG